MKKSVTAITLMFLILLFPIAFAQEVAETEDSEPVPESTQESETTPEEIPESGDFSEGESEAFKEEIPEEPEEKFSEFPEEEFERSPEQPEESEVKIPEGCKRIQTESGMFEIKCDFENEEFEEFDIKEEIEECEGKFEIIEGDSPEDITEDLSNLQNDLNIVSEDLS
ncbi:hypothetical protein DRN69_00680 [Candidatus Pacearchaeota archaeon]|nr:MAG: hypothetical protein DRN69_00680 [Candidatus Pacearchaeota archaeon]